MGPEGGLEGLLSVQDWRPRASDKVLLGDDLARVLLVCVRMSGEAQTAVACHVPVEDIRAALRGKQLTSRVRELISSGTCRFSKKLGYRGRR